MSDSTRETRSVDWRLIVAIFMFVFGSSGAIWMIIDLWNKSRPPRFTISAVYTLRHNEYEITDQLIWSGTGGITTTFQIVITPDYAGDKVYPNVLIKIKTREGKEVKQRQWSNFDKDSKPLTIDLSLAQLIEASEIKTTFREQNPFDDSEDYERASFDVEVICPLGEMELWHKDTIAVLNTPWYHLMSLSDYSFIEEKDVTVFIYIKNFGGRSDFAIAYYLYSVKSLDIDHDWYPDSTWTFIERKTTTKHIPSGGECTDTIEFSSNNIRGGKAHVVRTYVIKKQYYVDFKNWAESPKDDWRFADQAQTAVVMVRPR